MPVIDDHGHLLGMVALSDLAREACAGNLPAGGVASTLAAVSARRVAGSAE
jgi:CBS-domain-containing membrane protein